MTEFFKRRSANRCYNLYDFMMMEVSWSLEK